MSDRYFIRTDDVAPYSPANHSGTVNRRLVGPANGAKHLEVVLGIIQKDQGAIEHLHPGMEQVCYMLEGEALAEIDGQRQRLKAGECCFFPADTPHTFTAISSTPAKLLVIYSPPYGENPSKVITTQKR
jgi:quercetin dioxygenase-like cupin family protein